MDGLPPPGQRDLDRSCRRRTSACGVRAGEDRPRAERPATQLGGGHTRWLTRDETDVEDGGCPPGGSGRPSYLLASSGGPTRRPERAGGGWVRDESRRCVRSGDRNDTARSRLRGLRTRNERSRCRIGEGDTDCFGLTCGVGSFAARWGGPVPPPSTRCPQGAVRSATPGGCSTRRSAASVRRRGDRARVDSPSRPPASAPVS